MLSEEILEPRLSGLIAHIYDAAVDDSLWAGTATRIAETLGSTSTVLKLHGDNACVNCPSSEHLAQLAA